ncbi:Uncharacterised protein [BD1-7 clade bacterium]|uniref:Uncharacterized protein n=1 Tax=BD1-7 clade bacterium TaxID=2029982 RepID=A0A5S9N9W3_9GAMM|nr:Uncharacterised protein [BD1-7 clade bacterium]CAA0084891.1 Uncharacterised protein [BD1-7 clade bacterium]
MPYATKATSAYAIDTVGCCDSSAFIEGTVKRSCLRHQQQLAQKRHVVKRYPNMK